MEQNRNKRLGQQDTKPRKRPCLGCGAAFVAEGPFIRICGPCKESEEWQSGDADFALHGREAANDN